MLTSFAMALSLWLSSVGGVCSQAPGYDFDGEEHAKWVEAHQRMAEQSAKFAARNARAAAQGCAAGAVAGGVQGCASGAAAGTIINEWDYQWPK